MKCPVCEKKGLKSTVYPCCSTATLLWNEPYYDEDGKYHDHDPNAVTTDYHCSNGHRWIEWHYYKCWCGWSGGTDGVKIIGDQD